MARTDYNIRILVILGKGRYRPGWIREADRMNSTVRVLYGRQKEGRFSSIVNGRFIHADEEFRAIENTYETDKGTSRGE
jgi:hypothetical protein